MRPPALALFQQPCVVLQNVANPAGIVLNPDPTFDSKDASDPAYYYRAVLLIVHWVTPYTGAIAGSANICLLYTSDAADE